jgi:hypothetical protein
MSPRCDDRLSARGPRLGSRSRSRSKAEVGTEIEVEVEDDTGS